MNIGLSYTNNVHKTEHISNVADLPTSDVLPLPTFLSTAAGLVSLVILSSRLPSNLSTFTRGKHTSIIAGLIGHLDLRVDCSATLTDILLHRNISHLQAAKKASLARWSLPSRYRCSPTWVARVSTGGGEEQDPTLSSSLGLDWPSSCSEACREARRAVCLGTRVFGITGRTLRILADLNMRGWVCLGSREEREATSDTPSLSREGSGLGE